MQQSQLGKPLYALLIAGLLSACGGGSSNDDTPTLSAPSTNNGSSIVPTTQPKPLITPAATQPKPLITPAAPSNTQVDDVNDTFGWTALASYPLASDYEYSVDNGVNWTVAGDNPVSIGDVVLPAGAVQVRVKAQAGKHNAGNILKSNQAFTSTLPTPAAPTGSKVDDANDTFDWTNATGYADVRDYEYRIGNAKNWLEVDKKPLSVGNQNIAKDALQLRVKAKPKQNTAGKVLSNDKAFKGGKGEVEAPIKPLTCPKDHKEYKKAEGGDGKCYKVSNDGGSLWYWANNHCALSGKLLPYDGKNIKNPTWRAHFSKYFNINKNKRYWLGGHWGSNRYTLYRDGFSKYWFHYNDPERICVAEKK